MSKEAYYFSHDSNAHNDPKILKLLQNEGWAGYGLYWALIELLRNESNYKLKTQYDVYAFALRTEESSIKNVIECFDLFVVKDGYFFSKSLMQRMELREAKSKLARKSARARWDKEKDNANALQTHCEADAIKEKKRKEKKETTNEYSEKFLLFWEQYPNKQGKAKASAEWKKRKCENGKFEKIMDSLEKFKMSPQWSKDGGRYIPKGSTWVEDQRWEDEIESTDQWGRKI